MGLNVGIGQILWQMIKQGGFGYLGIKGNLSKFRNIRKAKHTVSGGFFPVDSVTANGLDLSIDGSGLLIQFPFCGIQGSFSGFYVTSRNFPGGTVPVSG